MKKELTIEHWVAYLPYKTKVKVLDPERKYPYKRKGVYRNGILAGVTDNPYDIEVRLDNSYDGSADNVDTSDCTLFLRPLSQLTETIEHGGGRLVPAKVLFDRWCIWIHSDELFKDIATVLHHDAVKYLHSLHFDTFGLIEAGLAEPIPSIPQP